MSQLLALSNSNCLAYCHFPNPVHELHYKENGNLTENHLVSSFGGYKKSSKPLNGNPVLISDPSEQKMYENIEHRLSKSSVLSIIEACSTLEQARHVHEQILESGLEDKVFIRNTIVAMYAKHGSLEEACAIFTKMLNPDMMAWNAIIEGHAQHGECLLALECVDKMQEGGMKPGKFIYITMLNACCRTNAIEQGRYFHEQVINCEFQFDNVVGNILAHMYVKCGSLEEALKCIELNQAQGNSVPEYMTYPLVHLCGKRTDLVLGRQVQSLMVECGYNSVARLADHQIRLFALCESLVEANNAFHTISEPSQYSWNAIINANVKLYDWETAFKLYERMGYEGTMPNKYTFLSILRACNIVGTIEDSRYIHVQIVNSGIQNDIMLGCTVVDMYIKCGSLVEAQRVFERMSSWDVVAWNAMISGYVQHGEGQLALECFEQMQLVGKKPDKFTFSSILKACGTVGFIGTGRLVHAKIIEGKLHSGLIVGSTIVDMYAKCGSLEEASKAFKQLTDRDGGSWGAMIIGYAQQGELLSSLRCFESMQQHGLKPTHTAFSGILTVLSHAGLVDEGLWYFTSMEKFHTINPSIFHITCMMDLLGRAGCFNEAEHILQEVLLEPDTCLWITLLSTCKFHGNIRLGKRCFDEVVYLDPSCAAAYVLISNTYSSVHVENKISYDKNKGQPQPDEAYAMQKMVPKWMREKGNYPCVNLQEQRNSANVGLNSATTKNLIETHCESNIFKIAEYPN